MGNRGQKRGEATEDLPADKRACSSLEYRPSSSSSAVQTPINSTNSTYSGQEARERDMDTSSSTSGSVRSDGDGEKDSAYGSCDSDEMEGLDPRHHSLRESQRRRLAGDHMKFKKVLSILSEEVDQSEQLSALTELCELLSFCTDSSISSIMADSFAPIIVKLARHESNPDIMLLAVRAITYLCDVHPRSSSFLVKHDAVPALCDRLMAIEYLDVAEQCLQALQKISREQPHICLQSGAIMAVLNYIDFFSTSVQRVALSTVVNICKTLPSECPASLMEAVPILCNLLQYEDKQLVENVATCLISIAERVSYSSDKLDELCKHGLIHQVTHLIDLNSRTTLCQPVYTGLVWLLTKLASGSLVARTTLFELNISSILKNILSNFDLLHGMTSSPTTNGHKNQVHEVLKLMNELLPSIPRDQDVTLDSNKEAFLMNQPVLLQNFGMDLLPVLIQVVNSGVNLYVCYGCLSVINKLAYFSKSDMLLELLKTCNVSSFLAGVFTRKDQHVLILALQIVDTILQKLPEVFSSPFIKEGVFFAVDSLLIPETSQSLFPMFDNFQLSNDSQRSSSKDLPSCLCYAFDSSTSKTCKLEKDSVHILAAWVVANYFSSDILNREKGFTDILQKLKTLSASLTDLVTVSMNDQSSHEEEFYGILRQIMLEINGQDPVSTFEFIESGIVKSLVDYLSNGPCLEKRFEVFAQLFSSSSEDFAMSVLIQKLQIALSSVENFPVGLGNGLKQRNSYATVPYGRCTNHPCLKAQFLRGEGENFLGDYYEDVITVDPFSSMDEIEGYLWPKVSGIKKLKRLKSDTSSEKESASPQCKSPDLKEADSTSSDLHGMQEDKANLPQSKPGEEATLVQEAGESSSTSEGHADFVEQKQNPECSKSCSHKETASSKLSFYLDGQELDRRLTLYQSILQRQTKLENDSVTIGKLWSQVYKITYRKRVEHCHHQKNDGKGQVGLFSSMFSCGLASDLEKSSPTYSVLFLLKSLEAVNSFKFHLNSQERIHAFAKGRVDDLDKLRILVSKVGENEFVNNKLNEKLEQQMRDPLSVSIGGMPSWCNELMGSCPFLFSFETRRKYFKLAALGQSQVQPHSSSSSSSSQSTTIGRLQNNRKKFLVYRDRILESAKQMMDLHARKKVVLEVEYDEEVGTGLGPTLEFYTLVGYEFQKLGLGLWREENTIFAEENGTVVSSLGLFPRPWSSSSSGTEFEGVIQKFFLLGQVVAKALQDGRVFDLSFSKAFYKVILGKGLSVYDIQSFDPELGRVLLEFQALVERKKYLESVHESDGTLEPKFSFRNMKVEDLCLDFSLPGYPEYILSTRSDSNMVDMSNLSDYVSLVVDATINSGISRQIDAFKSGFNQVIPVRHLQIFNEEELERLLCGERELWNSNDLLDHIKFDHGYTASSAPIVNLLEIIREFDREQQKAFLRFVTGAPRLPPGGLASLNPKLTIVRKHSGAWVDADLPSVMTCANYLKLPPYSSKNKMKEKLLYAITEGQGSFHLS